MSNTLFRRALAIALLLSLPALSRAVPEARRATVSVDNPHSSYRAGEVIRLTGSGFAPEDRIKGVVAIPIFADRTTPPRDVILSAFTLSVDGRGRLAGMATLPAFPAGTKWAQLLVVATNSNVRGTEWLRISGVSFARPARTATAGSVVIDDNNGTNDNIAGNSERIDFQSGSTGWTGSLFGLAEREYSDASGTTFITSTSISTTNANITSGTVGGYCTTTATYDASTVSIRIRVVNDSFETGDSNAMPTPDTTPPTVSSARAISLTQIEVTFDEAVSTPSLNADAIDNWAITNPTVTVSSLAPLGATSATTCTLTVASMSNRGVTPTVQFTTGTNEFEDSQGNDAASTTSPHITASDAIPPATVTITAPTVNTLIGTTSYTITATVDVASDSSMDGVIFEGSDDNSAWYPVDTLKTSSIDGNTTDNTFSVVWYPDAAARRFSLLRARAFDNRGSTADTVDTGDNVTVSSTIGQLSSSNDLKLAFRIVITSSAEAVKASNGGNADSSAAVTIRTENRYGLAAAAYNQGSTTWNLSSNSSGTATFWSDDAATSSITSANVSGATPTTFYYTDTKSGSPTITVSEASSYFTGVADAAQSATQAQTINPGVERIAIVVMPGQTHVQGATSYASAVTGTPTDQTAGTAHSDTVRAVDSFYNTVTSYAGSITKLTTSDANDTDPTSPSAFSSGQAIFSVTNVTAGAGNTVLPVTSLADSTSATYTVNAGSVTKLVAILPGESFAPGTGSGKSGSPSTQTAGTPFSITVRATDSNSNLVTSATNTVSITGNSSTTQSYPSNAALVSGEKTFAVTERQNISTHTFTASASGLTASTTTAVPMQAASIAKLIVIPPGVTHAPGTTSGKTGTPSGQTVNQNLSDIIRIFTTDNYWNRVNTGGDVNINLTTTDGSATITDKNGVTTGNATISSGTDSIGFAVGEFTFGSTGSHTLTATDQASTLTEYTTSNISVAAGPATNLLVKLPGQTFVNGTGITGTADQQTAGTSFNIVLYIVDASNNKVGETGSRNIDFSSTANSSPNSTDPTIDGVTSASWANRSISFTDGASANVAVVLYKAETGVTITAGDDSGSPTLTGTASSGITVNFGSLDNFGVSLATPQEQNVNFTGTNTVTARDAYHNTITSFDASTNNVTMSVSSGGGSVEVGGRGDGILDLNTDFSSGVADLTSIGFKYVGTAGSKTILATSATGGKTGSAGVTITVTPPEVSTPNPSNDTQISSSATSQTLSATFSETNSGGSYKLYWGRGNALSDSSSAAIDSLTARAGGGTIDSVLNSTKLSALSSYDYLFWWFGGQDGAGNDLTGTPTTGARARIILDPTVTFSGAQLLNDLPPGAVMVPILYVDAKGEMAGMSVTVTRIQLAKSGTATNTDIDTLKIYRDTDRSNTVNSGDVLLQTITVDNDTKLNSPNFNSFAQAQTVSGTDSIRFLVTISVNSSANTNNTIGYRVNSSSDITLGASVADVGGSFPVPSSVQDKSLPVALTSFTAIAEGGAIVIRWTTESELNNQGFTIYRAEDPSADFQPYSPLIRGRGSVTSRNEYQWKDVNVVAGKRYFYRIESQDFDGTVHRNDEIVSALAANPLSWKLLANVPNPFNPSTTFHFEVPEKSEVTLRLYDLNGRTVRTLVAATFQAGAHRVIWDGTDERGAPVGAGVYIARFVAAGGAFSKVMRVTLIR